MIDKRQELATLLCTGDSVLDYQGWLAQEASDMASKIAGLDEIPPKAILPLALLSVNGESDARKVALRSGIDEVKAQEYLDALCEFKFAEETWNGYKATPFGEQVFEAIGERMVTRELYELKRKLQQVERIDQKLKGSRTISD